MNVWQSRYQPGVSFIRNDDQRSGLRHCDIRAGNPHFGFEKLGSQLAARKLHQFRNVRLLAFFNLLVENRGDFFFGHVDCGHDHVRRRLSRELNNPFSQVGFSHLDAG